MGTTLDELEAIKQLKARYFRLLDTKDWDGFRALFTDDVVIDTTASGGDVVAGADAFVELLEGVLAGTVTVHQGHMPEIELTGPDGATGVWALHDIVMWSDGTRLDGFGHYHERYRKGPDGWRIASSTLTRLHMDMTPARTAAPPPSPPGRRCSPGRPRPPATPEGSTVFLMRFDMRAPSIGAPTTELYAAALEMASWAESRGALTAAICEHHTMDDGYLPSPVVLATAMAARTTTLPIMTAALVLPLYDPIRLAEDMVVLDIISNGRVSYIVAVGYRPEEFEHHGVDFRRRGKLVDEQLALLLRAKTGEPFEHDGRRIHVTPAPVTPGGPRISWGGGSAAAARRAGRFGLDFIAQGGDPSLEEVYAAAARDNGHEPGFCMIPSVDMATTVFVAHDLDRAWDELGPHLLHDVTSYAALNPGNTHTASLSTATTVDELRAENRTHRILTVDEAVALVRAGNPLPLQPLAGGLPPDTAWPYLHTVTNDVIPQLPTAT